MRHVFQLAKIMAIVASNRAKRTNTVQNEDNALDRKVCAFIMQSRLTFGARQ